MDSSISRAWTPHSIFLSDRNDPLWECWYNLSNLTNQRVSQELLYRNGYRKKWLQAPPPLLSPVSFRFTFVFALSHLSQLSRSLEQATCLQFGQSPCNHSQERNPNFWLACTEYRLAPDSPCMWFKTRFNIHNATKFTTLSTFHGHYSAFPRRKKSR